MLGSVSTRAVAGLPTTPLFGPTGLPFITGRLQASDAATRPREHHNRIRNPLPIANGPSLLGDSLCASLDTQNPTLGNPTTLKIRRDMEYMSEAHVPRRWCGNHPRSGDHCNLALLI